MDPMKEMGRWILIAGGLLLITGAIMFYGSRLLPLGRLWGDIHLEGKNYSVYFPLGTSIIISIILTILLNLFFIKR